MALVLGWLGLLLLAVALMLPQRRRAPAQAAAGAPERSYPDAGGSYPAAEATLNRLSIRPAHQTGAVVVAAALALDVSAAAAAESGLTLHPWDLAAAPEAAVAVTHYVEPHAAWLDADGQLRFERIARAPTDGIFFDSGSLWNLEVTPEGWLV